MLTIVQRQVVESLLLKAASEGRYFYIVVLEIRPDTAGSNVENIYANSVIPATVVLESTVGYVMERAHLMVVGAKEVVENGIIVNKMENMCHGNCDKGAGQAVLRRR